MSNKKFAVDPGNEPGILIYLAEGLSGALYERDPAGTGCVENEMYDEYDRLAYEVVASMRDMGAYDITWKVVAHLLADRFWRDWMFNPFNSENLKKANLLVEVAKEFEAVLDGIVVSNLDIDADVALKDLPDPR